MDLRLSAAGVPFASGSLDGACPVSLLLLRAGMPPGRHTSLPNDFYAPACLASEDMEANSGWRICLAGSWALCWLRTLML